MPVFRVFRDLTSVKLSIIMMLSTSLQKLDRVRKVPMMYFVIKIEIIIIMMMIIIIIIITM